MRMKIMPDGPERLAQLWAEADPALKAEFTALGLEFRCEFHRHTEFVRWREERAAEQRRPKIEAMGVDQQDASFLAYLGNETRARLLLDGKSLP